MNEAETHAELIDPALHSAGCAAVADVLVSTICGLSVRSYSAPTEALRSPAKFHDEIARLYAECAEVLMRVRKLS